MSRRARKMQERVDRTGQPKGRWCSICQKSLSITIDIDAHMDAHDRAGE